MSLERATDVSTKLMTGPNHGEVPVSEIYFAGRATGKRVPGADLEAAVRVDARYLLFMTDDVPFEETLGIFLLDQNFDVIDSARLGAMYSTGMFSTLELHEPRTVGFRFIGETTWTVEVLDRPETRLPFIADAPGVVRPFGFKRHFVVRGQPQRQR